MKVSIPVGEDNFNLQKRTLLKILNKIPDKLSDTGKDKLLLRLSKQSEQSAAPEPKVVDLHSIKTALEGFKFDETILPDIAAGEKVYLRGKDLKLHFTLKDHNGVERFASKVREKVQRAVSVSQQQQNARMTRIRKFNSRTQRINEENRNRIWGNSLVEQSFLQNNEALNWLQDPTLDGSKSKSRDSILFRVSQHRDMAHKTRKDIPSPRMQQRSQHGSSETSRDRTSRLNQTATEWRTKSPQQPDAVLITESDQVQNVEGNANPEPELDYQMRLTKFVQRVDLAKKKAARAIQGALDKISSEPGWLDQVDNE